MQPLSKKEVRGKLRQRRRNLTPSEQKRAARELCRKLKSHPIFLRSKHIAFYVAEDGEIDPYYLLLEAEKMGKRCFLPVLNPFKKGDLWFAPYKSGDELWLNYFGILEPSAECARFSPWALDLVLMPLVAFDRQGHRLGMGGGFYDRTFAFKNKRQIGKKKSKPGKPILAGLAHKCQEEDFLACEDWDIPLDYIGTDKEVIEVKP